MTSSYQMGSGTITAGSCGKDLNHSSRLWGQTCLRPPTPAVPFMLTQEPDVSQAMWNYAWIVSGRPLSFRNLYL